MDTQSLISQFNQVVLLLNQALDSSESYKKASDELFTFLDQNYEFYLNSKSEERNEIREIVQTNAEHNLIDFFPFRPYTKVDSEHRVFWRKKWLTRGLIVSAIEDGIRDHRDTIDLLAHLFVASEEKDLNPKSEFQKIATIANDEPSIPGAKPMSQILLEIPRTAHIINDQRKKFL